MSTAAPSSAKKKSRRGRRLGRLILMLLLPGPALFVALQLAPVRARLAVALSQALSRPDRSIHIGSLHGVLPLDIRVETIRCSDRAGAWLDVSGVRVRISLRALLKGKVVLHNASASSVILHRWPVPVAPRPGRSRVWAWPPRGPELEARGFSARRVVLEAAAAGGERLVFRLRGCARFGPRSGLYANAWAFDPNEPRRRARIEAQMPATQPSLRVEAVARDAAGGPLSRRVTLGPPRAVYIHLRGAGPAKDWAGEAEFSVPGIDRGAVNFRFDARSERQLDLAGQFEGVHIPSNSVLDKVHISAQIRQLRAEPEGHIRLRIEQPEGEWTVQSDFVRRPDALHLTALQAAALGIQATGELTWVTSSRRVEGELLLQTPYLNVPAARWNWSLGGEAEALLKFSAQPGASHIQVDGQVLHATTPMGTLRKIAVEADLHQVFQNPEGRIQIEAAGLTLAQFAASNLVLTAKGNRAGADWTAHLLGGQLAGRREAIEVESRGRWENGAMAQAWHIQSAQGRSGPLTVHLQEPAALRIESNGWSVAHLVVDAEEGLLTAAADFHPDRLQADMVLTNLPLALLARAGLPSWRGRADGRMNLRGTLEQPVAELDLALRDVKSAVPLAIHLPPAQVHLTAQAQPTGAVLALTIEGWSEQSLTGRLNLPLTWSLRPFAFASPPDAPWEGEAHGTADLARFIPDDALDEQVMEGRGQADVLLAGSRTNPEIRGQLTLSQGRYEHLRSGTLLDEIGLVAKLNNRQLVVTEGQASDGEAGRYSLSGTVDLAADAHFPVHLDVQLDNAALLRHERLSLTADGQLALSGTLDDLLLAGRVQVREAEYRIPDRLPPEIVDLNVVEINAPAAAPGPKKPRTNGSPLKLDLEVRAPSRVMVRGRGLDSEWRAHLKLDGPVNEPAMAGTLDVVRGRFLFLGRRFALGRGTITLDGRRPMDPTLNLRADASAPGIETALLLSGSLNAPELTLTSDPPRPPDEILALLLFGRSADLISPMQAVRLAYGLKILRGGDNTFDVLGRGQSLLHLDQLDLQQDEDQPGLSAISAGKYLGDRVYVQGEKSIAGPGDRIMVEFNLSRSLRLQTESSPQIREGIRLNWTRDY